MKINFTNNRREFLKRSATAAIGAGCLSVASKANNLLTNFPVKDDVATHNMLVVGEQTAFLSHLPMFVGLNRKRNDFVTPHRYQVILEATFTDGNSNLTDTYTADRKKNPDVKMYTFNPALFVLPDLNPAGSSPLRKFRGNGVFRGHLERGGEVFIGVDNQDDPGRFDVNVVNVVHFHKFVPGAARPAQLQYILFGKGPEMFLAHFIAAPPDFDQVISVKITGQSFTNAELSHGVKISLPGKANTSAGRLRENQQAAASFMSAGSATAKTLTVEAVREFYFEESELFMPPGKTSTAEERRSGFGE